MLGKGRISVIWGGPVCLGFLRILPSPCNSHSLPCICGQRLLPLLSRRRLVPVIGAGSQLRRFSVPPPWDRVRSSPLPSAAVFACAQALLPLCQRLKLKLGLGKEKGPGGGKCMGFDACPTTCVSHFLPAKGPLASVLSRLSHVVCTQGRPARKFAVSENQS